MYEYYLYCSRATYGAIPRFIAGHSLPSQGYASLYAVTKEVSEAIESTGSTKGFKGVVWSPFLHIDFDTYEAAERAVSRLKELGVKYDQFDTGGRGCHFRLYRRNAPSHLLPNMDRAWIEEQFPEADKSIYTHLHPFRLEGTIHEKTGNIKRVVNRSEGSIITIPPLKREKMQAFSVQSEKTTGSIFDCFRVVSNTVPVENGERHATLVRLLYGLKDEAGVSIDIARFWVDNWNKMLQEPKSEEELEKVLRSIYG